MRPVEKKNVGDSITLEDGTAVEVKENYCSHQKARPVLLSNLGHYCSYCETMEQVGSNLDVEHVQPKSIYGDLKYKWSNFLLACRTCNGKRNKTNKNVVLGRVRLPHLNNTFKSLVYFPAGVVKVNPTLTGESKTHAEELRRLVGFDKFSDDDRIEARGYAWTRAIEVLKDYESEERDEKRLQDLIKTIKENGFWSIWFTVFKGHDEVRAAMIDAFPGTAKNCFDPDNHYEPIDRNPGNLSDLV